MMNEFGRRLAVMAIPATLLVGCAAPQGQETTTASGPAPAATAGGARTTRDGVYTTAQADRGRALYQSSCAACHNTQEFTGTNFQATWGSRSVGDIHQFISEMMPMDAPGSLSAQQYTDIVAFIIRQNGYPAGSAELPTSRDALRQIRFAAP